MRRIDGAMHIDSQAGNQPQSPPHSHSNGSNGVSPTVSKVSTNGQGKVKTERNGTSSSPRQSNGTDSARAVRSLSPTWYGHNREEVARVLIQGLSELGYHTTARALSRESGFELEGPTVAAFRNAVLEGEWAEAETLLFGDGPFDAGSGVYGSGGKMKESAAKHSRGTRGLTLIDGANTKKMLFWMRQQKYLELLERRDLGAALLVLRQELTPLHQNTDRLHALGGLIMCQSADDLRSQAQWDGAAGQSRYLLLSEVSKSISPSVMIPEHRLAILLDQVKNNWISNCLYHNTKDSPSLYHDHICDREDFPNRAIHELRNQDSEIWFLAFSNDGTKLASASKDKTVVIYDVASNFAHRWTLGDHEAGVCYLAWSPDDTKLLTCTRERDNSIRVWDVNLERCISQLNHFESPTTVAAWCPDGQSYVVGSLDSLHALEVWNLNEELIFRWKDDKLRVYDLALSPDGHRLVVLMEKRILVYDFRTRDKIAEWTVDDAKMTSVTISKDSRHMLISMNPSKIKLMVIDTGELIHTYEGHKQSLFMIRSSFGGANESFVVSGSEDSRIYVWRTNGQLTEALPGHRHGCVNAISWHPTNPAIFASAGDDAKVRIWSTERYAETKASLPPSNGFGR